LLVVAEKRRWGAATNKSKVTNKKHGDSRRSDGKSPAECAGAHKLKAAIILLGTSGVLYLNQTIFKAKYSTFGCFQRKIAWSFGLKTKVELTSKDASVSNQANGHRGEMTAELSAALLPYLQPRVIPWRFERAPSSATSQPRFT
jgi:hypothetical protein